MSTVDHVVPASEVRPATQEEVFLCEVGRELYKGELPFVRDTAHRAVTLITALLGGTLLVPERVFHPWTRAVVAFFFFFALGCAAWAMMPIPGAAPLNVPAAIRAERDRVIDEKCRRLWWAALHLGLGFTCAIVGLFVRAVAG